MLPSGRVTLFGGLKVLDGVEGFFNELEADFACACAFALAAAWMRVSAACAAKLLIPEALFVAAAARMSLAAER